MSDRDGGTQSYPDVNPFSPTAVARVTEFDDGATVTIETPAFRQALGAMRDFVGSSSGGAAENVDQEGRESREGEVLAIVGDYGTGKTHLAIRLMQLAGDAVRSMYIDAAADDFVAVYRRFIGKLTFDEVRDRVKAYYSDIVADSLRDTELPSYLAERLRAGDFDPVVAVDRLALMEASLLRELKERLLRVTRNDEFGTALMLMLRRGFEKSVWSWLQGDQPDAVLVERGITTWIGTDVPALEAMGVIALLFGGSDHKFLLVIDELDKVLSAASSPKVRVHGAFRELLRVFSAAGAMLVLVGLPDFLQEIGRDAVGRIGQVVEMTPLTSDEVREFIMESHLRTLGAQRLFPFSEPAVDYLVQVTRGTARPIIRLCYHSFRRAAEEQRQITADMVQRVAKDEFFLPSADEVRNAVKQVLDRNGFAYLRDHRLSEDGRAQVDFWITVSGADAGCVVLVVDSAPTVGEIAVLRERAGVLRTASPDTETLVVVNGYLSAEHSVELTSLFGVEPIVYDPLQFAGSLAAALSAMTQRIQRLSMAEPVDVVRERVERINRLQATTQSSLENLGVQVEDLRTSADKRLDAIQDQLRLLGHAIGPGTAEPRAVASAAEPDTAAPPVLPTEVNRIFTEALAGLAGLDEFDRLLSRALGDEDTTPDPATGNLIRARLRTRTGLQATGVAVLLQKSVRAFRRGVERWYRMQVDLPRVDREGLDELCGTYDSLVEYLPVVHLPTVADLARPEDQPASPAQEAARVRNMVRARETLENLSLRVRAAVLRSVSTLG